MTGTPLPPRDDPVLRVVGSEALPAARPPRALRGLGRARCHGAISVVNAIPTGFGAALGISLQTEAEVRLNPTGHLIVDIVSTEREPTALVRTTLQKALAVAGVPDYGAWVTTWSQIPAARGLKSSSAAANAVLLAALDACDALEGHDDDELLRLGVEAAIAAGVTLTGAFDDASACFRGGLCVTDNGRRELLQRAEVREDLVAVVHVPAQRLEKQSLGKVPWKDLAAEGEAALRLAREGRWPEALRRNGEAVARLLRLDQAPTRAALEAGAITAGISGTGPSTAAVCEPAEARPVAKALRKLGTGTVLTANLTNAQAQVVRRA